MSRFKFTAWVNAPLTYFSVAIKGLESFFWFLFLWGVLSHLQASVEMWIGYGCLCAIRFVCWILDNVLDVDDNGE